MHSIHLPGEPAVLSRGSSSEPNACGSIKRERLMNPAIRVYICP